MTNYWLGITSHKNVEIDRDKAVDFDGYSARRQAVVSRIQPGDRILLYVAGLSAFWAISEVTGPMYEDHTRIWDDPDGGAEDYPLRLPIKRILVLPQDKLLDVRPLVSRLSFISEKLKVSGRFGAAFRGLRALPRDDYELIESEMKLKLEETDANVPHRRSGRKRYFGPPLNFRELRARTNQ
jgi:predicted RNA-binding protein